LYYYIEQKNARGLVDFSKFRKFEKTFEAMEGFGFVIPVTDLNRSNTGKDANDY
jgi:hypothetical protein